MSLRCFPLIVALATSPALSGAQVIDSIADNELHQITRAVVTDSLIGGGSREGQRFFTGDSASPSLLSLAGVPFEVGKRGDRIICPGGTTKTGAPVELPVGYWVSVKLHRTPDKAGWVLRVTKGCEFIYMGREPSGFYEGGGWEIRKVNGRWQIVRMLDRVIT